jgi:hypothetical protein
MGSRGEFQIHQGKPGTGREVQVLDLEAIRALVALAWVAAGFLYDLGMTLEWAEVRLLARLGGWVERRDYPPGKQVLTLGVQRLLSMLATQAILHTERQQYGTLPPRIARMLGERQADE